MMTLLDNNKDLIASELKNYKAEPQWTYLIKKGIDVKVFYLIKKINKETLTLNAPISYTIYPKYK